MNRAECRVFFVSCGREWQCQSVSTVNRITRLLSAFGGCRWEGIHIYCSTFYLLQRIFLDSAPFRFRAPMPSHAPAAPDSAEPGNGNSRNVRPWQFWEGNNDTIITTTTTKQRDKAEDPWNYASLKSNNLPVSQIGHREKGNGG